MTQRALGPQFVQQCLGPFKDVGRYVLALKQITKATLHLGFS